MNRIAVTAFLFPFVVTLLSPDTPPPQGQTSGTAALQKRSEDFWAQQDKFRRQAEATFNREKAREKTGDCVDAKTTYDMNVCLSKAIDTTTANYQAYAGALRSLLGLRPPGSDGIDEVSGPTGRPLTAEERVKEFDTVEAAWETFRKAQCAAAYNEYRGGTIAPSMEGVCTLRLMRGRMRDLDSIYFGVLHG